MNKEEQNNNNLGASQSSDNKSEAAGAEKQAVKRAPAGGQGADNEGNSQAEKVDPLYQMLKPLHNLPRGKNTWNPEFIRKPWFWPLSAVVIIILFYVYPYIWDFFADK